MKESILDVVHRTAKDLSEAGVMDKQTMHQFDALCLPKLKQYDGQRIKAIREKARVSQVVESGCEQLKVKGWAQGNDAVEKGCENQRFKAGQKQL